MFVPESEAAASPYRAAEENKVDEAFLQLLDKATAQGRAVRPNSGPGYAPSTFADDTDAGGIRSKAFASAMDRLFKAEKIVTKTNRRGSKYIERGGR
ncbi:MAG: hypothetical protein ABSG88_16550 [Bradyrhizobium sp.]